METATYMVTSLYGIFIKGLISLDSPVLSIFDYALVTLIIIKLVKSYPNTKYIAVFTLRRRNRRRVPGIKAARIVIEPATMPRILYFIESLHHGKIQSGIYGHRSPGLLQWHTQALIPM
jgi:hypothetical protein